MAATIIDADCIVQWMDRLTVAAAARILKRHPENVREMLRDGRLKGEKFGRDWFITKREIARFKRAQEEQ